jgi:hypothetical protein
LTRGQKIILIGTVLAAVASVLPWIHQEGGFAPPTSNAFSSSTYIRGPVLLRLPNWLVLAECVVAFIVSKRLTSRGAWLAALPAMGALLHTAVVLKRVLNFTPIMVFDAPRSLRVEIGLPLTIFAAICVLVGCFIPYVKDGPWGLALSP